MAAISERLEEHISRASLSENTISARRRAVKYFIRQFGDVDPNVVTHKMAEQYKSSLSVGFYKPLKPGAKNAYLANLSPLFSWMVTWEYIEENPFNKVKLFRVEKKIHKTYTPEEIEKIFAVMADTKDGLCWQTAYTLALCGMRKAEFLNLVVSDICFEDKPEIQITVKEDTKTTWRWGTKGKSERYAPVPDWAESILVRRINELEPPQPYIAIPKSSYDKKMKRLQEGKFNLNDRNEPWINFGVKFGKILKRAGVEHKTIHDTRTTLTMNLFKQGVPMVSAKEILGHKTLQTTYDHYTEFNQREIASSAGKYLNNYIVKR